MSMRVLITCPAMQRTIDAHRGRFRDAGVEIVLPEMTQQLYEADLLPIIGDFDGVIAGDDEYNAAVLAAGVPRLKAVAKWGIGLDAIDLDAAKRLGIEVTNTPDVFADEVADLVMGYLVTLARRLHLVDRGVREGAWPKPSGRSLAVRTLGVVGHGSIGRAVARRGLAFGMRVIATDVRPVEPEAGVEIVGLEQLLRESDAISLNCALTPENHHLLDVSTLALVKPGAWLVNTARGGLVNEVALVDALARGQLAGAALDVFEVEPLPAESPLRNFDNVLLGSHNASNTVEAVARVNELAIANVLRGIGA